MPFWSAMPSLGEIALGERFGWGPAVALQLVALGLLAGAIRRVERRRGAMAAPPQARRGWGRWVRGPWPLAAGAVALAGLNAVTLLLAGHPWTITWAFTLWGGKVLQTAGYDLSTLQFWTGESRQAALAAPVFADVTSVMDVGLVVGAFLGAGLAGRFAPSRRIPPSVAAASLLGGLLLGYGSRIAFGCNIGAYLSGIASTSLHGWLWAVGPSSAPRLVCTSRDGWRSPAAAPQPRPADPPPLLTSPSLGPRGPRASSSAPRMPRPTAGGGTPRSDCPATPSGSVRAAATEGGRSPGETAGIPTGSTARLAARAEPLQWVVTGQG